MSLVNDRLRWLDSRLFKLDTSIALSLGYAPDPLTQVFDGRDCGARRNVPCGQRADFHADRA